MNKNYYYLRAHSGRHSTRGTVVCDKEDFFRVGGYDEIYQGWGGEDIDLYRSFIRIGLNRGEFSEQFIDAIDHDNGERSKFYENKNINLTSKINDRYMRVKNIVLRNFSLNKLNEKEKKLLYQQIVSQEDIDNDEFSLQLGAGDKRIKAGVYRFFKRKNISILAKIDSK